MRRIWIIGQAVRRCFRLCRGSKARKTTCTLCSPPRRRWACGGEAVAWALEPDYALVVDVTCPDDVPGALHEGTTALGAGAAIKVMDHSVIAHPAVVARLSQLAEKRKIPVQRDLLKVGGTDGGAIHVSRSGIFTGGISIPCRYTHTPAEMIDRTDLDACVQLIQVFCESELIE